MTKYLAFTLGPIYATLNQARKTRELWASSYIFSVLMRELIIVLKAHNKVDDILSPIVDDNAPRHGAGIYPDRCFVTLKADISPTELQIIIDDAIIASDQRLKLRAAKYLKKYFRVYAAKLDSDGTEKGSPILTLNRILDTLELRCKMPPTDEEDLVSLMDDNIQKMYSDGNIGSDGKTPMITFSNDQMRLPSLIELATDELQREYATYYKAIVTDPTNQAVLYFQQILRMEKGYGLKAELQAKRKAKKKEADNEQDTVIELKKALNSAFKFRHKYVCFVKADGDNMGKLLAKIKSEADDIKKFSTSLGAFAQKAVDHIVEYGGIPVYAGGDDLLFVASLQKDQRENIFTLIDDLNKSFDADKLDKIAPAAEKTDKPSLSFGLSISYYKYPMSESLDAMQAQLDNHAKQRPGKNAIAFRVLKHSGQPFGTVFEQNGLVATEFKKILAAYQKLDKSFLSSIMHRLTELKSFLEHALLNGQSEHFFKHHFNESVHTEGVFITAVHELAKAAWKENLSDIKVAVNQVFAILRFVQFLNQEDHD